MTCETGIPSRAGSTMVEAVIFDLDGVLADTEPVHFEASRGIVAPQDLALDEYLGFIGSGWADYLSWIESRFGIPVAEFESRYTPAIVEALQNGPPPLMSGADALVRAVLRREVPVAVASMSKRAWVEPTLDAIGMRSLFPLVITHDDVSQPKPDPEIYLQAASLLGVPPENCIAVEDSRHGVAAAVAAGMWVVQLRQTEMAAEPQPEAHAVIDSFREFDLGWLEGKRPNILSA